jgi:hypothetical protein
MTTLGLVLAQLRRRPLQTALARLLALGIATLVFVDGSRSWRGSWNAMRATSTS